MKVTNQIIQQITSKVQIERIYQFSYIFLNQEYHHLLIALDSKCCLSPPTLQPTIDMCLDEAQGLTYMLINSGELKTAIKNGNLFYTIICQEQNLCYHDGKKPIANLTKKELELIIVNKGSIFYSSQAKANDFMEGVEFYTKKGNLHQAAFMLHQATEQFLKGFSDAVFNKDKPGYSLQKHLEVINRFLPAIGTLFPKGNQYEYGVLELLDKAYTTVRHKNKFVIEEEEFAVLTSKIELFFDWSHSFFKECLNSLETQQVKGKLPKNTENSVFVEAEIRTNLLNEGQKKKINLVVDKICKQYPVSQINVLGFKTAVHQTDSIYNFKQLEEHSAHCYLLVILKGSREVKSYSSYHGDLKITMLFHHEKELNYALGKHNRFFIHTLKTSVIIYKSLEHPVQFNIPEPDWLHSLKSANHFFEHRLERLANMFWLSANHIHLHMTTAPEASLLLLTHCIEQACVSYIYIQTGYRVNQHHLPFLLDLCALIDTDILKIMHQNTDAEKMQMEVLMNCVQYIRNKHKFGLDYKDISNLLERCNELIKVVKASCLSELNRLGKLAHPKEEVPN